VISRHCEPTGRREVPPDDRLREAIQSHAKRLDCFVATLLAMTVLIAGDISGYFCILLERVDREAIHR